MAKYYPQPTIIGSGLTGLLISLALSKAGIGHVLIGGPPPVGSPRLGESLNLEATLYFLSEFPELADCYYQKDFAHVLAGNIGGYFSFSFLAETGSRIGLGIWGKQSPQGLIHFDRVRLDAALYEKAVRSPYCTQLDTRVSQVICDPGADTIRQLLLQDGEALPVSHVFDATGFIRLLARQLDVPRRTLGRPQHVVYAHYHRQPTNDSGSTLDPWRHGTNILRLYPELDGVSALAWCIPLGNTISMGVTTPLADPQQTDDELLQMARHGLARYGIDFGSEFTERSPVRRARMEFYTHARAHGANWLLTSAAHTQVWWTTSAGVDTSIAAANASVAFLKEPDRVGALYHQYLRPLVQSQSFWNWVTTHAYGSVSDEDTIQFSRRLFWSISNRWVKSLRLEERNPGTQTAVALYAQIWDNPIWAQLPAPATIQHWRATDGPWEEIQAV